MVDTPSTAVFFCPPETERSRDLDVAAIVSYAESLPSVERVVSIEPHVKLDPMTIVAELRDAEFARIVVCAEFPGRLKPALTRAMALSGRDPTAVRLATYRGPAAQLRDPAEAIKATLACAIYDVPFSMALDVEPVRVEPTTLVIGGGVAGIQAALEIADAGQPVVLVEREPTIGGHMAMFDKTFPTLDCAACILTPKMVAVDQHDMIELLTYAEVEGLTGSPGAYRARIRKKARRVDIGACIACNACMEICPVSVPSEFDNGVSYRKAIFIAFPQAVPNSYVVDEEACLYVQTDGKKCGACLKKCPKDGIHLDAEDEIVEIDVGNVIVATGYDVFDARRIERYGYGRLPNVLTALEFERLTNASGPTGGRIVLKTKHFDRKKKRDEWVFDREGPSPKDVAIVHCVGSRDAHYNPYCSRVCCMYSLKFAHLVKEKLPDATCHEFYIDMRAYGKDYEAFFERIQDEGVFTVRGRSARVVETNGGMSLRGEDIVSGRVLDLPIDMLLLAVGLEPPHDTPQVAEMLGIRRDRDGWFSEREYNADPTSTARPGIHVAGVCQGPKDIPDTVAQASAVAARVLKTLVSGRIQGSAWHVTADRVEEKARALFAAREEGPWQSAPTRD